VNGARTLDFRSDTRTVPDATMRAAMAGATVGDDVYGDDPTVAELEGRAAALVGTEGALFTPTSTMANLLAPLAAFEAASPPRLIVGADSHMAMLESSGLRRFGRIDLVVVRQRPGGLPHPAELTARLAAGGGQPTVVALENTSMMHAGNALDAAQTGAVAALARRYGARLHLDGARLANAAVALGVAPAELAASADTVTFGISKGLGAPAGGLLCGRRPVLDLARELRSELGGGLHQAGVLAAPGLIALDRLPELAADHATAAVLAAGLAEVPRVQLLRPPRPTNIVLARLAGLSAAECAAQLAAAGVRVLPLPNGYVRFVTQRVHEADDARAAVRAFAAVAATAEG
jgi:threonine aldolase